MDTLGAPIPSVELSFPLEAQFLGRTDANGSFAIERHESARSLCERRLVAYRLGFRPSEVVLPPARERAIDLGRIVLEPGAEIEGWLATEKGPLPDCTVYLLPVGHEDQGTDSEVSAATRRILLGEAVLQTRTGLDGRFLFRGAPLGIWEVWAIEPPYIPARATALPVFAGVERASGASCATSRCGTPRQGVLLHPDGTLCTEGGVQSQFRSRVMWSAGRGRMDRGRFVLEMHDAKGEWTLTGEPGAKEPYMASEPVHPQPGATDVVIRLRPARHLTLSVLDAHGVPVEDFGYRIELAGGGQFTGSPTGWFGPIEHHPGGTAELKLAEEPTKIVVLSRAYHDGSTVDLAHWQSGRTVQVVVEARPRIEGRVVTPGEPLAKILVQAAPFEWARSHFESPSLPWQTERFAPRPPTRQEVRGHVGRRDYVLGVSSLAYQPSSARPWRSDERSLSRTSPRARQR